MMNSYLESAKDLNDLTNRMGVLTKLCALTPGAEFYASDLGLSGQTMHSLNMHDVVHWVKGKEKVEFIPADHSGELYRKIEVNCWTVTDKCLADHFRSYCGSMAALYSAQMLAL